MATVWLAPGHAPGQDCGPISYDNSKYEYQINLDVAKACRSELQRHDITVEMSRENYNDPFVSFSEQGRGAARCGARICFSIHHNGAANKSAKGFEYLYRPNSSNTSNSIKLGGIVENYINKYGLTQEIRSAKPVTNIGVLNSSQSIEASILVEGYFMTSSKDWELYGSKSKDFGIAYAHAILDYLGIPIRPEGQTIASYTAEIVCDDNGVNIYSNLEDITNPIEEKYNNKDIIIIIQETTQNNIQWVKTEKGWIRKQYIKKVSSTDAIIQYTITNKMKWEYDKYGNIRFPFERVPTETDFDYTVHDLFLEALIDMRKVTTPKNETEKNKFIETLINAMEDNRNSDEEYEQQVRLVLKSAIKNQKSIVSLSSSNIHITTSANAFTDIPENFISDKLKNNKQDIINYFKQEYDEKGWNKNIKQAPEVLNFWFDFMNIKGEMGKYAVQTIGSRPKAINDDKITGIYFQETPTVLFLNPKEYEKLINNRENYSDMTGYTFIQLQPFMENYFSISAQGKSAKDELDNLLYQHTYITDSTTLTAVPIYHLQPNTRIFVKDDNTEINGEFILNKITIPLQYNGTTSLTTTKAVERIY